MKIRVLGWLEIYDLFLVFTNAASFLKYELMAKESRH